MAPHGCRVPIKVLFCPTYLKPEGATGNAAVTQLEVASGGVMKYLPAGGVDGLQVTQVPADDALHPSVRLPAGQGVHGT